jgi:hypothetical protein
MSRTFAFLVVLLLCALPAGAQVSNAVPPPAASIQQVAPCHILLDGVGLGGKIRACVGCNGALGSGTCLDLPGRPGLYYDPDGAAGPLWGTEDSNIGYYEERWCIKYSPVAGPLVHLCNSVNNDYRPPIPGFTQVNTSVPGLLQSKGFVGTPDGLLAIDQIVSLKTPNACLNIDVTLTNVGGVALSNLGYSRNHDPDFGAQLGEGTVTTNQTLNRPLPGPLPEVVAATVYDNVPGIGIVETRTIGLGTKVQPPAGFVSDIGISTNDLVIWDPDAVINGGPDITRGPSVQDVGEAIAWRTPALMPGASARLNFCYCGLSQPGNVPPTGVAPAIVGVFNSTCGFLPVKIDVKFCSNPNGYTCGKSGKLPVTIFGDSVFHVADIDVSTLRLCLASNPAICTGPPPAYSIADRGNPRTDLGASSCLVVDTVEMHYLHPDGYNDLDAAFDAAQVSTIIGCAGLDKNDISGTLIVKGMLYNGIEFQSVPYNTVGIDQLKIVK